MDKTRLETLGFDPVEFATALFEYSDLAIFLVHVHGPKNFTYSGLNPTHEKLTGLTSEAIRNKHPHDFLPPALADVIVAHYEECRQKKATIWYEETIPFEGRDTYWITKLIPLIDKNRTVTHIIGASLNINHQKAMEEELLQLVEFNQTIISISQMGFLIFEREGYCVSINEAAQGIFGITDREAFFRKPFWELHPLHENHWENLWKEKHLFPEVHFHNNVGEEKWIILQSFPYRHGSKDLLVVSATDITSLKKQQQALEEQNHLIMTLLRYLPNPIASFREDLTLCFHNEQFAQEFAFLHPENNTTTLTEIREALSIPEASVYPLRKGHEIMEISLKNHKKNRHYLLEQYRIGELGSPSCRILWSFSNITRQKDLIHKLEKELHRDFLTGLYNRRGMADILPTEWKRAQRDKLPLSLLMIDIDFFKNYNDSLGHAKGDTCLKEVSEVLKESCFRPGDFLFRYGGEEFLILLTNTSQEGAFLVGQRIQHNLAKKSLPHPTSPISASVTVSIGIASFCPEHTSWQTAIQITDKALYQAKKMGRNTIVLWREETSSLP
ncbi:MAG: diguanylate cyclase [Brevinematales bacterium]|nr:diguanylate cyclase [Brevinematales bacterium]